MYVIITFKYEKDPMKNNREKVATPFFQIITLSVAMVDSCLYLPTFRSQAAIVSEISTVFTIS